MTHSKLHVPRSLFLGFENLFEDLERIHSSARSGDNYPPHNVIKTGPSSYSIELAVAGFKKEDLRIVLGRSQSDLLGHQTKRRLFKTN